jgi:hypothetical protein
MKITRNALSQIIREEYNKVNRRKKLKENVGLDMNSVLDMIRDIEANTYDVIEALESDNKEEAWSVLDDMLMKFKDVLINIQDMVDGQPTDYTGSMTPV